MKQAFLLLFVCIAALAQTAVFPTAVVTDKELGKPKDFSVSVLTHSISDSTLTIPVANGAQFQEYEIIQIDTEQMQICSISGNTLTLCSGSRGFNGTTPAVHGAAASVRGIVSSYYIRALAEEVKATEASLGASLANIQASSPALTAIAGGNPDFGSMTTTRPIKTGASPPATCSVGQLFYDSDATAGQNLYGCTATDTWTLQAGGGSTVNALTSEDEADTENQVFVSAADSGRAMQPTPLIIDPSTGALSNSSDVPSAYTLLDHSSTPDAPSSGLTLVYTIGGKLAWRTYGGSEARAAPDNASYVTLQAESALSAESSLGSLNDNAIVAVDVADSVASPRAAAASDVTALFTGAGDYLKSDGTRGTPSSGATPAFLAGIGYWGPFDGPFSTNEREIPTSGVVIGIEFTPPYSMYVDYVRTKQTSNSSEYLSFAIYRASDLAKIGSTAASQMPSSGWQNQQFSNTITLVGGVTYYLVWSSDASSSSGDTITHIKEYSAGAGGLWSNNVGGSSSVYRRFTTTITWSSDDEEHVPSWPSTLGTRTYSANDPIVFYFLR